MFRSWKIARIAGISLRLHSTFLLMLLWMIFTNVGMTSNPWLGVIRALFPVMLFSIIVFHELGHALAARRYGISTRDITLYPFGGIAHLEQTPSRPLQELAVAAAGPAVNVVLAILAWALGDAVSDPLLRYILDDFLMINLGLALFNLLPAFPMDGGRILRALLATRTDQVTATRQAAHLARQLAWVLGLVGLFTFQFNLVFIGILVWLAATAEQGQVLLRSVWTAASRPQPTAQAYTYYRGPGEHDPRVIDAEYKEVL